MTVSLYSYLQHNLLEAVSYLGLVVLQLDNIGVLVSQYLRYVEELAWLVWQLYREAEYPASGNESLINQSRNSGNINIAATDNGCYLFPLERKLVQSSQTKGTSSLSYQLVLLLRRWLRWQRALS